MGDNECDQRNFLRQVAPVAGIVRGPNVMVVNATFPARTVPEFIAYAKINPGKLNFGSGGNGTSNHLAGELVHVPYRATLAVTDLVSGQVQLTFDTVIASIGHI